MCVYVYLRVAWREDISSRPFEILKIVGELFFHSFLGFISLLTKHVETPSPVACPWYPGHKIACPTFWVLRDWERKSWVLLRIQQYPFRFWYSDILVFSLSWLFTQGFIPADTELRYNGPFFTAGSKTFLSGLEDCCISSQFSAYCCQMLLIVASFFSLVLLFYSLP